MMVSFRMGEILVAIDGGEHSERVVDYATDLAKCTSSSILLVYVAPEVKIPEGYLEHARTVKSDPSDYYEDLGKRIAKDAVARMRRQNVKYQELFGAGNAMKFILDTATSRRVSLIVLGVHGLHRLSRIRALGSVARGVIENSTIPVVSVPCLSSNHEVLLAAVVK
jgi:nucleotide-binding universal stress UspA family protein